MRSNVWRFWVARTRIAIGTLAIAVLGVQFYNLMHQPRLRGGAIVLIAAVVMLWLNRRQLHSFTFDRRASAFSWLLFPGYLLSLSLLFALVGMLLSSLSLAAMGAVFYLGWMLAVRCATSGWNEVAHGWAVLLLLCFPSHLTIDPLQSVSGWMVNFASQSLDLQGIFHLIDPMQMVLIDTQRSITLNANSLFSTYGLFSLLTVVSEIGRAHV